MSTANIPHFITGARVQSELLARRVQRAKLQASRPTLWTAFTRWLLANV